jgi:hypothetical protein
MPPSDDWSASQLEFVTPKLCVRPVSTSIFHPVSVAIQIAFTITALSISAVLVLSGVTSVYGLPLDQSCPLYGFAGFRMAHIRGRTAPLLPLPRDAAFPDGPFRWLCPRSHTRPVQRSCSVAHPRLSLPPHPKSPSSLSCSQQSSFTDGAFASAHPRALVNAVRGN